MCILRRMRPHFEFKLYPIPAHEVAGGIDATLALMGSQGWELRGLAYARNGDLMIALQRPLDEDVPLPDRATLAATLEEPLSAPSARE